MNRRNLSIALLIPFLLLTGWALMNGGIAHLNLVWRPFTAFATGIEYMWGAQRATSEALGRASRFQAMTAFYF